MALLELLLFEGKSVKDYQELVAVGLTIAFSLGVMVLLGAWWQR